MLHREPEGAQCVRFETHGMSKNILLKFAGLLSTDDSFLNLLACTFQFHRGRRLENRCKVHTYRELPQGFLLRKVAR